MDFLSIAYDETPLERFHWETWHLTTQQPAHLLKVCFTGLSWISLSFLHVSEHPCYNKFSELHGSFRISNSSVSHGSNVTLFPRITLNFSQTRSWEINVTVEQIIITRRVVSANKWNVFRMYASFVLFTIVQALCYKPEDGGFDSRWRNSNFQLT
jgi:hypothetical protein